MNRGQRPSRADTEQRLRDLARAFDTPAPDYSRRVLRALATHDERAAPAIRLARRFLQSRSRRILIAAVALLAAAAIVIAVPGSRRALAQWLGFAGISIRHTQQHPASPPASGRPAELYAGATVTLAEARAAMARHLRLPAGLPAPAVVYLRRDGAAVVVTLAYSAAPHLRPTADTGYALILTEIARAGRPLFAKILAIGANSVAVTVVGHRGVFIDGPQQIITLDNTRLHQGQPEVHEVAARASANTIIWTDGATTYRLEGDFGQHAAIALASTVR
jgi:hypothetical protein